MRKGWIKDSEQGYVKGRGKGRKMDKGIEKGKRCKGEKHYHGETSTSQQKYKRKWWKHVSKGVLLTRKYWTHSRLDKKI